MQSYHFQNFKDTKSCRLSQSKTLHTHIVNSACIHLNRLLYCTLCKTKSFNSFYFFNRI